MVRIIDGWICLNMKNYFAFVEVELYNSLYSDLSLSSRKLINSWPWLRTEHTGIFQNVCCCSIATVSRVVRSFGNDQLLIASVICLPCQKESELSQLGLCQTAAFHLEMATDESTFP